MTVPDPPAPSDSPSSHVNSAPAAPRKKTWGKRLAVGCGVPFVINVALLVFWVQHFCSPDNTPNDQSTLVPVPASYTGDWRSSSGTSISIRADGTATIDKKNKMLHIEGEKNWKIDEPPLATGGTSRMKLNGVVFQRSGGFDPDGSLAADGVPSDKALRALIQQTLLDFNRALSTKNFTRFHATLATPFKEQTKPQQFNAAFEQLLAQKLDVGSIQNLSPIFAPKPTIDSEGYLSVQGHYPTRPARVNFALKYFRENNTWKLMRIDISTGKP